MWLARLRRYEEELGRSSVNPETREFYFGAFSRFVINGILLTAIVAAAAPAWRASRINPVEAFRQVG